MKIINTIKAFFFYFTIVISIAGCINSKQVEKTITNSLLENQINSTRPPGNFTDTFLLNLMKKNPALFNGVLAKSEEMRIQVIYTQIDRAKKEKDNLKLTDHTFNINAGAFQATGNFNNLAAGSYTIVAKDVNGCTGSSIFTLTAPNPCAGVTITVSNVIVGNRPCEIANGSITSTGGGGTGPYTYNINGGIFQTSNLFAGLSAAVYSISAKDANGCVGTVNATVNNQAAGPLFLAVKNVIDNNCISCHNNTVSNGGVTFQVDCNIVTLKDRIRERAVNGNPSAMPPTGLLPASERLKITNWINAGGRFTD